jgi:UDP-glucose-4-epimerase GalE
MSQTVLVTGGAGFIGSHVCKALASAGVVPICYDSLEKGYRWAVRWGPFVHGDVGDAELLEAAFKNYRPRAVVHLAGYIEVGESVRCPIRYLDNNVRKSQVLIDASLRHGVEAFVFSSTCAVYGATSSDAINESHPIAPLNPYAESKVQAETSLQQASTRGLKSAALRYFNAAGSDPDGEIGESHQPETHLIALACDAVLGLGDKLTLHGMDYPIPDGSCVRDFIHVCDLAEAHIRAIDWLKSHGAPNEHIALNIGTGEGYSVLRILEEISRNVGKAVPYVVGPRRSGDAPRLVADATHARKLLGWRPKRSLVSQIESTVRWRVTQRAHRNP